MLFPARTGFKRLRSEMFVLSQDTLIFGGHCLGMKKDDSKSIGQ
jgi:hypothetical protein